jgi:hypothetical protein
MSTTRVQPSFWSAVFFGLLTAVCVGLYTDFFIGLLVFLVILGFYWLSKE